MQRTHVQSTDLESVGYDEPTRTLEIRFLDGSIYQYDDVPQRVYLELMNAPRKGVYFHAKISRAFNYHRVL